MRHVRHCNRKANLTPFDGDEDDVMEEGVERGGGMGVVRIMSFNTKTIDLSLISYIAP